MIKKISIFFCSGFGVGRFPIIPGTLASLAILPVIWFIKQNYSTQILICGIVIYYLLSYFFLKKILKDSKNKDPSYVVCDEYIGQSIALIFCEQKLIDYIISFLLFRILDIKKPFPINYFDNQKSISGVLLDDVIAGLIVAILFVIYYGI